MERDSETRMIELNQTDFNYIIIEYLGLDVGNTKLK